MAGYFWPVSDQPAARFASQFYESFLQNFGAPGAMSARRSTMADDPVGGSGDRENYAPKESNVTDNRGRELPVELPVSKPAWSNTAAVATKLQVKPAGTFNGFLDRVVVIDPGGPYGVELDVFFTTHEPVPDRPDYYVKVARVRAWAITESLILRTEINGSTEMVADALRAPTSSRIRPGSDMR